MSEIKTTTDSLGSATQSNVLPTGSKVSQSELELSCINLISQLEMQIASARTGSGHVENAPANTDKLLSVLLDFCDMNLDKASAESALKDIHKASLSSLELKEVLASLGWGFAFSHLFGKSVTTDVRVRQTYAALGDSLLCACVSVLKKAVETVGTESPAAEMIEQSTAVFVSEFKANW